MGLRRWSAGTAASPDLGATTGASAPAPPALLPRPDRLRVTWGGQALPPQRDVEVIKAGFWQSVGRLFAWLYAAWRFGTGVLLDRLRRRDSPAARARRLRETLQDLGPTFIKLGQQLSLRLDLLPYVYARELEQLLDRVPYMPIRAAVREIEEAAGAPLREVFAYFDPEPIGSASLSCVYQGRLKSGERVAVKVRRPHVAAALAADLRALGWLLKALEQAFLAPGMSRNFLDDLRTMLFAELDYILEARFNEIFRRDAAKHIKFATAPHIYFELSNRRVMVAELVSGILLSDVLAAVEQKDEKTLAALAAQGIRPKKVAWRLTWVTRYGGFEGLFFHADLHPANVLVQADSKLVLIDFGSCSTFSEQNRVVWRRIFRAHHHRDVGSMASAAVALLEPLPPIDVHAFTTRVEALFWDEMYALRSKHAEWWERTTANLWIGYLALAREFELPVPLNIVRMIRASMLVDTIAARLNPKVDHYEDFYRYAKGAGRRSRRRLFRQARRVLSPRTFGRVEELLASGGKLLFRLQRFADANPFRLLAMIGKAAYGMLLLLKTLAALGGVFLTVVLAEAGVCRFVLEDCHVTVLQAAVSLLKNGWVQALVGIVVLVVGRRFFKRLDDTDDNQNNNSIRG